MFTSQTWNEIISTFPYPQLLQTWEWGEVKSRFGWAPHHKVWEDDDGNLQGAALVLERTINLRGMAPRLRMHYTPKGPLLMDWNDTALRQKVITDLIAFAKARGAFLLKIDPDVPVGRGEPDGEDAEEGLVGVELIEVLKASGWHYSNEQVQFQNTVLLDLTLSEDEILASVGLGDLALTSPETDRGQMSDITDRLRRRIEEGGFTERLYRTRLKTHSRSKNP